MIIQYYSIYKNIILYNAVTTVCREHIFILCARLLPARVFVRSARRASKHSANAERRKAEISGPFIGAAADASPLARRRVRTEKLREMPPPPPVTI